MKVYTILLLYTSSSQLNIIYNGYKAIAIAVCSREAPATPAMGNICNKLHCSRPCKNLRTARTDTEIS